MVVTGAARGLGASVIRRLVALGWSVWATDIDADQLARADLPTPHRALLDVRDKVGIDRVIRTASETGPLQAWVNNAAVYPLRKWDQLDPEEWGRVIEVNLTGTFLCSTAAAKTMRDSGVGGSIVNVVSTTLFSGNPSAGAYVASKAGVVGFTRSLAKAVGGYRIRVNAVAPGLMPTDGVVKAVEEGGLPRAALDRERSNRALPGITDPNGVAGVIAFLVGDGSAEITGQTLIADGGVVFP